MQDLVFSRNVWNELKVSISSHPDPRSTAVAQWETMFRGFTTCEGELVVCCVNLLT